MALSSLPEREPSYTMNELPSGLRIRGQGEGERLRSELDSIKRRLRRRLARLYLALNRDGCIVGVCGDGVFMYSTESSGTAELPELSQYEDSVSSSARSLVKVFLLGS